MRAMNDATKRFPSELALIQRLRKALADADTYAALFSTFMLSAVDIDGVRSAEALALQAQPIDLK
jgi:hypothetical protein